MIKTAQKSASPVALGMFKPLLSEYFHHLHVLSPRRVVPSFKIDDVYFPTNERRYFNVFRGPHSIVGRRGVYIGTSNELNITHMAYQKAPLGYIVDINAAVTEIVHPIIGALLLSSNNRAHFLSLLFACPSAQASLEENQLASWEDAADVLVGAFDEQHAAATAEVLQSTIVPYIAHEFQGDAAAAICSFMERFSMAARQSTNGLKPLRNALKGLSLLWRRDELNRGGIMSSEEAFTEARDVWFHGRMRGVTGDLAGDVLPRIGDSLQHEGHMVGAIYLSNAEEHILTAKAAYGGLNFEGLKRLHHVISNLPRLDRAIVVSSLYSCTDTLVLSVRDYLALTEPPSGDDSLYSLARQHIVRALTAFSCRPDSNEMLAKRFMLYEIDNMLSQWCIPPEVAGPLKLRLERLIIQMIKEIAESAPGLDS